MIGLNGGLIGARRLTDTSAATGIWTIKEQVLLKRANIWPLNGEAFFAYNSALLHMDGSNGSTVFTDSSLNNFSVTVGGNTQISNAQNKFGGASAVFDGNGDYLQINSNVAFDFNSDFTIELWVYTLSNSANQGLIVRRVLDTVGAGTWGLQINNGVASFSSLQSGGATLSLGTIPLNTWTHVAVSRSGSTLRGFVNGSLINSSTDSTNYTNTQNIFIGAWGRIGTPGSIPNDGWLNGYIDEIRITKGKARYTSNFTPPIAPFQDIGIGGDPFISNVTALLHMDGSNGSTVFTDSSSNALTVTALGNAQLSTAQYKFGTASGAFDGTGDYLSCSPGAFGANDFTIEAWIRPSSLPTLMGLYDSRTGDGDTLGFIFGVYNGGLGVYLGQWVLAGGTLTTNTWSHVALTRSSGVWRIFINGTAVGSTYTNAASLTRSANRIGMDWNTIYGFNGYIDDFRITNGVARYTTTFTPSVTAFPDP